MTYIKIRINNLLKSIMQNSQLSIYEYLRHDEPDFLPYAFYINLEHRKDRYDNVQKQMEWWPKNKLIRIDNNITSNDALVSISGKYNRANLNYEICLILNTIKNKGEFDFI